MCLLRTFGHSLFKKSEISSKNAAKNVVFQIREADLNIKNIKISKIENYQKFFIFRILNFQKLNFQIFKISKIENYQFF